MPQLHTAQTSAKNTGAQWQMMVCFRTCSTFNGTMMCHLHQKSSLLTAFLNMMLHEVQIGNLGLQVLMNASSVVRVKWIIFKGQTRRCAVWFLSKCHSALLGHKTAVTSALIRSQVREEELGILRLWKCINKPSAVPVESWHFLTLKANCTLWGKTSKRMDGYDWLL